MKLPCKECGAKCCTLPAMSRKEFKRIRKYIRKDALVIQTPHMVVLSNSQDDPMCPLLVDGKCSVYPIRPEVCKMYGSIPALPCRYLYPGEAERKMEELDTYKALVNIGGMDAFDMMRKIGITPRVFNRLAGDL